VRHAHLPFILAGIAALSACGGTLLITPYRMDIQQGNYVSQDMVSQLKLGMSKEQVRYVLGTPLVADIFHADRWDYVYYREPRKGVREGRKIAVLFEDGKLVRVVGDVVAADPNAPSGGDPVPKSVEAPRTNPEAQKPPQ
jgi:outer membrane protein assembly factor BamE